MPRGGARVGAGRKPTRRRPAVVLGMDGNRRDLFATASAPGEPSPAAVPQQESELLQPPSDLTPAQQDLWRRWAPLAVEQRTLVPATVPGFRELCEQLALKQTLARRIGHLGAGSERAAGRLGLYVKLAQRLDSSLARFKLTGFGKPDTTARARPSAANPWAQVAK